MKSGLVSYSASYRDNQGTEHEFEGTDLTELANEVQATLVATRHDGVVQIVDEPGFVRGFVRATGWQLQ